MIETINKLIRTSRYLVQEAGREPTPEEIAEKMEIPLEKVLEAVESSPTPPYDLKADPRLKFSIERWYTFYSQNED